MLPPTGGEAALGLVVVTLVLTALTVVAAVLGGYKRVEKIMTALLVVILVCFIIVAIKGLLDWHDVARRWRAGWCRRFPPSVPVAGRPTARASASRRSWPSPGRRCRRRCCCPTDISPRTPATRRADIKPAFWKTVHEPRGDLGPVLGRRDRRGRDRAARRLHRHRARRTSASATTRRSKAFRSPARCSVRRFPGALGLPRAAILLARSRSRRRSPRSSPCR